MKEKEYRLSLNKDEVALLLMSINTETSERENLAKKIANFGEKSTDSEYIADIEKLKALYDKILNTRPNKKELPGDQTIRQLK